MDGLTYDCVLDKSQIKAAVALLDDRMGRGYTNYKRLRSHVRSGYVVAAIYGFRPVGVSVARPVRPVDFMREVPGLGSTGIAGVRSVWRIETAAVEPGFERQGIAMAMIERSIRRIRIRIRPGVHAMAMMAWVSKERGQHIGSMPERLGFWFVDNRERAWAKTACAICGESCECSANLYLCMVTK